MLIKIFVCTYHTGTFSVRLVANGEETSDNPIAGRLEVYFSGKWGSVCSDGFTLSNAKDFCDVATGSRNVRRFGAVQSSGLE